MGCCFAKSSALPKEGASEVETVPRVSFPVVVTNPVSTTTGSSPSTCSTVSTSSDDEIPCEDESKQDGPMPPVKAREVLRRMVLRWTTAHAHQLNDKSDICSPKPAVANRKATPRPVLCAPAGSGTDGSDSDPWDIVPGGAL